MRLVIFAVACAGAGAGPSVAGVLQLRAQPEDFAFGVTHPCAQAVGASGGGSALFVGRSQRCGEAGFVGAERGQVGLEFGCLPLSFGHCAVAVVELALERLAVRLALFQFPLGAAAARNPGDQKAQQKGAK